MIDSANKKKNKKCTHYLNGYCKYGKKCEYSHEEPTNLHNLESKTNNNIFYRQKNGFCPYGTQCKYSHDLEENYQFKDEHQEIQFNNNIQDTKKSILETSFSSPDKIKLTAPNYLLCCPLKTETKQDPVSLKQYLLKRNLEITEMFYNQKIELDSTRQNVYKNDFSTFKQENDAIDNQEKLLSRKEVSFHTEIKRLNSIHDTNKHEQFLKSAYDREYERALKSLPVYGHRAEILECLTANNVLVLIGLTGSGKST
jgi:hypothetical protein